MNLERSDAVRVRVLRIPSRAESAVGGLWLALGVFTAWILCYLLLLSILTVLTGSSGGSAPGWIYVVSIFGGAGASVSFVIYCQLLAHRKRQEANPTRSSRLNVLFDRAVGRFPHRAMESSLRRFGGPSPRVLKKAFQAVPPGDAIVATRTGSGLVPAPIHNAIPFEMIDLTAESEEADGIAEAMQTGDLDELPSQKLEAAHAPSRAARIVGLLMTGVWVLLWGSRLVRSILRQSSNDLVFFAAIATIIALPFVGRLFYTRNRFLVPGGIVFRTDAAWRSGQEVSLVTPASSPLFIDFRDGTVMVLDRCKVRSFTCDESTRWLLLAGWQSTARTPTLEEVKTFLGAEDAT